MKTYIYSLFIALGTFFTPNDNSSLDSSTDLLCATSGKLQKEELCFNVREQRLYESLQNKFNRQAMVGQTLYIPVRAHYFTCEYPATDFINYANCAVYNSGNPTTSEITTEINDANTIFSDAGLNLQLYLTGINTHVNNDFARYYTEDDDPQIEATYAVQGELNLYYFYRSPESSQTQHALFPWKQLKGIYLNRDFFRNGWSLAHELGHWFGLYHTWGTLDFKENVTRNPTDPCYNCETEGDELCDTPAALQLDFFNNIDTVSYSGTCEGNNCSCTVSYVGNITDGCGQTYVLTDEIAFNLMSYGFRDCSHYLTDGQVDRMWSYVPQRLMNDLNLFNLPASYFCPNALTLLSENVNQGQRVESSGQIDSYQKILTAQSTLYDSGSRILLKPGFQAATGASMSILIDGCEGQKQ